MQRRSFLKSSLVGAGLAAGVRAIGGSAVMAAEEPAKTPKAELKLCSQDGRLPGKTLKEKVANLQKYGGVGLEVWGRGLPKRVKDIKEALKGTKIKLSAVCAGYSGCIISPDKAERERCVASAKDILTAAGELGSTGLVLVPAFNRQKQLVGKEARAMLVDMLGPLGEHAQKAGTRVLLEPLNRREAYFLRQVPDAAAICRDVKHPGVALMGDFYHMYFEETSDEGAFLSAGKYCHHVHLGSIKRKLPGQDARSFVSGFRGLKRIGYRDYCSLECGCKGDPKVEIPKSFRFLEKQWAEATI